MKRRQFMASSAAGAAGLTGYGCSGLGKRVEVKSGFPEIGDDYLKVTRKKPEGGSMPYGEIGKTGITVSKFGYGSHMHSGILPYTKERERAIREAYDLGITLFDVYDKEGNTFQYEPMGKYLAPMINDVVISISILPYDGRDLDQELHRDLRVFGRDYIDMVRIHAYTPDDPGHGKYWPYWEQLFKYKEQGKIRAVGLPIHYVEQVEMVLENYPLDFVILPFNFYHNLLWTGEGSPGMNSLAERLREKNMGVIAMKPFASDWFISPFIDAARTFDKTGEISLPQAALRWIINSDLNPDATLAGMYKLDHVYEDVVAYYQPVMTDEERELIDKLRKYAKTIAHTVLPDHYRFLDHWAGNHGISYPIG